MDGERFDRVVKAFNEVRVPRRGVFGVLAGMGALFTAYRLMFAQPYCIPQGEAARSSSDAARGSSATSGTTTLTSDSV